MPEHHVPVGWLDDDLRDIERQGEIVISISPAVNGKHVVVTRFPTDDDIETRTYEAQP